VIQQVALQESHWVLAMADAMRIRNWVSSSGAGGVLYELITGRRAKLSSMRVFGCSVYVHVDMSQRRKPDDRALRCVFVGYARESSAWLVYNHATHRIVSSRNVVFDEAVVLSHGREFPCTRNATH
jgi:hypothetical protein